MSVMNSREASLVIRRLVARLEKETEGLMLGFQLDSESISLRCIVLPSDGRSKGAGTQVMNEILSVFDENKWTLTLTPDAAYGGDVTRLVAFYERFGFVTNEINSSKDSMMRVSVYA